MITTLYSGNRGLLDASRDAKYGPPRTLSASSENIVDALITPPAGSESMSLGSLISGMLNRHIP